MKEATLTDEHFEPREGIDERLAEQEWLVRGEVATAGVARVWVSPERARWLREERRVVEELADGGVVVELPYGSVDWLVRETLKGVGDLVVLEPDEARDAVAGARGASSGGSLVPRRSARPPSGARSSARPGQLGGARRNESRRAG